MFLQNFYIGTLHLFDPVLDLINLIIQNHPEFLSEIEGISEDEIKQFEKLSPVPVPKPYKEFLRIMGKNSGRIKGIYKSESYNVDGTVNKYEDEILIDYISLKNAYKTKIKSYFKYNKHRKSITPEAITGSLD